MGNVGFSEAGVEKTLGQGSSTIMPTSVTTIIHQEVLTCMAAENQKGRDVTSIV